MSKWKRNYDDNYLIFGEDNSEGYINEDLIRRIDYVIEKENEFVEDSSFKYSNDELRDLSEYYRMCLNMDKKQLSVAVTACIEKYPMHIFVLLAQAFIEKVKGEK